MAEARSEWVTAPPAPLLAPYVTRYVGYRRVGAEPGVHRGLPSRHMTFIVSIGDGIDVVAQTDPAQAPARYRCAVSGLQATSALIAYGARLEGVAIELTPLGSRALFGVPARALWDTTLELDEVVGAPGGELWERLQEAPDWPERFAVCDRVLGRWARPGGVEPALERSWRLMLASAGTAPVAELAATVGWTRQHLARRFGDEFGLSPKLAARVVRFDRARRMLQTGPAPRSIARVAASCGYYDQAHLTRDFVELAGCPPSRWLADELPSVQDPEALEGAT